MKFLSIFVSLIALITAETFSQELRGTWLPRPAFTSKEALAQAMDSLAANNFNVVYIDVWTQGYPLWISDVFYSHTGFYTDPDYNGRDILAEAIAEGHRNGLQVEAWFEYGFVGRWNQKGPIFNAHPDWVAKKKDGTEIDASNFYWMIHSHPDIQDFLIAMAAEIARNYDVDGIQLDRIRYSSLDYGYDSYTVNLYKSEHNGSAPPTNTSNSAWIRWRANKLNDFVARFYDSLKTINSKLNISNAPGHYSATSYQAYNSYCQDWIWWLDNNKVDNVQLQMYVSTPTSFQSYLNYVTTNVVNKHKVFPSFAIKPGGNEISNDSLLKFFQITNQNGFKGNAIWYYLDLLPKLSFIKSNIYTNKNYSPYSLPDWREYKKVTKISNLTDAIRSGSWLTSSLQGLSGNSIYTTSSGSASLDYYVDIPVDAIYEVYVFNVVSSNRTSNAEYAIYHEGGNQNCYVDQTNVNKTRFVKLGDFNFTSGRKLIARLTNNNLAPDKLLSADAVFISLNRRLSPDISLTTFNVKIIPEGLYNKNLNTLNSRDTIFAYLRHNIHPYSIIDSALGLLDSLTFQLNFKFKNVTNGIYYLVVNHRNSIETWSKSGGELVVKGSFNNYDFTSDSSMAFGNNMKKIETNWCIFSGDVNQDGVIDISDLNLINNNTYTYSEGYLKTDLNGDNFVDLNDIVICDNNIFKNIIKIIP